MIMENYIIKFLYYLLRVLQNVEVEIVCLDSELKIFSDTFVFGLIGFEVTLVAITFALLPLLLKDNDPVYLGYTRSNWVFYERKKRRFLAKIIVKLFPKFDTLPEIALEWVVNMMIICLGIFFYSIGINFLVVILFVVFIYLFCLKVVEYLSLASSDKCYSEIEKDFLEKISLNDLKTKDRLINSIKYENSNNIASYEFLLNNLDKSNIKNLYYVFHNSLIVKFDLNFRYLLIDSIYQCTSSGNMKSIFYIDPRELKHFLEHFLNDENCIEVYKKVDLIVNEMIKNSFKNNEYIEILSYVYASILRNKTLSIENKNNLLKKTFRNVPYSKSYTNEKQNKKLIDEYSFRFFKYIIDIEDELGLSLMYTYFSRPKINLKREILNVTLSLLIYLFYLIEIEEENFVKEERKAYLRNVKIKLLNYFNPSLLLLQYKYSTKDFYNFLNNISNNWEVFLENFLGFSGKIIKVDDAISTAKKTLQIYSKRRNNFDLDDYDLSLFKRAIINFELVESEKEKILLFAKFININEEHLKIDNYIESINAIVKPDVLQDKFKTVIEMFDDDATKEISEKINKMSIFNNSKVFDTQKYEYELSTDIETLEMLATDNFKYLELEELVENSFCSLMLSKIKNRIKYFYDKEEIILKKMKNSDEGNFIILPKNDYLGETYKFGDEYTELLKKFKPCYLNNNDNRFILKKFKTCFTNLHFKVRELTDEEIEQKIKTNLIDGNYVITNHDNYSIKLTKEEMKKYCRENNLYCLLEFEIGIDIDEDNSMSFEIEFDDT